MSEERQERRPDPITDARIVTRRGFLNAAALLAGSAAIACSSDNVTGALSPIGPQRQSGSEGQQNELEGRSDDGTPKFDHVVVVMQENRSFDHMLGWAPRADGRQAGLTYVDNAGVAHQTYPLAPDYQGCSHKDPDHSYSGARIQYDAGRCDGFLRGANDIFAIGYYRRQDLDFFGQAVRDWTIADRYFCSVLGPTFPNRIYQHAAQTDRLSNTFTISTLPTIWDRLAEAGRTGRYYYHDLPFLGLWGAKYLPIARPAASFYMDCAAGTLPDVSFVDPAFLQEISGTGMDDHPHNDVRAGQSYLNRIYTALTAGPKWDRTLLIINYDEWGGFFDHVAPPKRPITTSERALGNDGRLGFRTPLMLVSPYARAHQVASAVYDHTSVLKLIEKRWNLRPLAVRDASALSLGTALDFEQQPRTAPAYAVAPILAGAACPANGPLMASSVRGSAAQSGAETDEWAQLYDLARSTGWRV
jgi:phospholipase C